MSSHPQYQPRLAGIPVITGNTTEDKTPNFLFDGETHIIHDYDSSLAENVECYFKVYKPMNFLLRLVRDAHNRDMDIDPDVCRAQPCFVTFKAVKRDG